MHETRKDVTFLYVEVVMWPIHVARDDGRKMTTVILVVSTVHYINQSLRVAATTSRN